MKERLKLLYALTLREIRRMSEQPIYFFCILIVPIFSLIFFLTMMHSGLPTKMPIAIVDCDNSSYSCGLSRSLNAFEQTEVLTKTASFQEATQLMQKGDIYGIFYIPEGFGQKVIRGDRPKISFYTNNSYIIAGSLLFRDMKTISELINGKVRLEIGKARGISEKKLMAGIQPIVVNSISIGNPWLSYSIYLNNVMIPAILQLMIMYVTIYSIGTELKFGTSQEWLKIGKGSILFSLSGKLLIQLISFLIVGAMALSILYSYSGFPLNTGWFPIFLAFFLLIVASQAIGIFIISMFPILRLALCVASLIGILAFSMTGFSFPQTAMPEAIRALSNIIPIRHYFLIYEDQALSGRPFFYSLTSYFSLISFFILPLISLKQLKKVMLGFKYVK